jgi:hypothetical protein
MSRQFEYPEFEGDEEPCGNPLDRFYLFGLSAGSDGKSLAAALIAAAEEFGRMCEEELQAVIDGHSAGAKDRASYESDMAAGVDRSGDDPIPF